MDFDKNFSREEIIDIYKLNLIADVEFEEVIVDYFDEYVPYNSFYLLEAMNKFKEKKVNEKVFNRYINQMVDVILAIDCENFLENEFLNDCFSSLEENDFDEVYEKVYLRCDEYDLPFKEKHLTDLEKLTYIKKFRDFTKSKYFDIDLYKECLDYCVSKNYPIARDILAYMYYGNEGRNHGFECDYKKSEELLIGLVNDDKVSEELKGIYSNTLGYIYYYGRVNNGNPEYEKAYQYYSFASSLGMYEATFKLSDMYRRGLYVKKSELAAFRLVNNIYDQLEERFLDGEFECPFADVCIRMANFYRYGTHVSKNLKKAYSEFLKADLALNLKMQAQDFFGNYSLREKLDKNIKELEDELKINTNKKTYTLNDIFFLNRYAIKGVTIKFKENKDEYKITFKKTEEKYDLIPFIGEKLVLFDDKLVFYVKKNKDNRLLYNRDVCNICRNIDWDNGFTFLNDNNEVILKLNIKNFIIKVKR